MPLQPKVKILNYSLDEREGVVVIRGVVDPNTLRYLQVDKYQREVLGEKKIGELMHEHRTSRVPDIDVGMRGERVKDLGEDIELLDPVYIIDGLQRVTAGMRVMVADEDPVVPVIGATVLLNTTVELEREMFDKRNIKPTKLSPNIHLRNRKDEIPALGALFRLTHDSTFVLRGKVQWTQQPSKSDLITATVFVKTAGRLLHHQGAVAGAEVLKVASGLDDVMKNTGRPTYVANVRGFFDIIDQAWGLADIEFRGATVLKGGFLDTLARVFSDHENFWDGDRLAVNAPMLGKLSKFKVKDPMISQLAGSGGPSMDMLYDMLVKHLNSGVRKNHLLRRGRSNGARKDGDQ